MQFLDPIGEVAAKTAKQQLHCIAVEVIALFFKLPVMSLCVGGGSIYSSQLGVGPKGGQSIVRTGVANIGRGGAGRGSKGGGALNSLPRGHKCAVSGSPSPYSLQVPTPSSRS